ncbi:MAG: HigA family addiction module antitoxin [Acetivibrio ethanolgignens]
MSNYIEHNDKVAFHPGYYIKEIIDDSGLTQEDFAKRLNTTPKNLSILIRGEQSLSIDIAAKLSRMLGTTVAYWLNLQQNYDAMQAEFISDEELIREREVFKLIDYKYFKDNFGFPDLSRNIDEQIKYVREFLGVSSLNVLKEEDLAVNFRSYSENLSESNIINANVMVQIAINRALKTEAPKFNKKKFENAIEYALTQTCNHAGFFPLIKKAFHEAGVVLVVLPNLSKSGINGATKKVDGKILLMVNDRRKNADTFWFTLFHEIGHIMSGDYGITFKNNKNGNEDKADYYAQRKLIPQEKYDEFIKGRERFDEASIRTFADEINRDPGIVLGRLQNDGIISFKESVLSSKLRHKYKISIGKNQTS